MKLFRVISLSAFTLILSTSFGQLPKIKIDNLPGKDAILSTVKSKLITKLSDARKEYDTTSFNYAVALSDNAGLFENEERFKKNQKLFLELLKSKEGQSIDYMEEASNYNEAGEMMYASNHFVPAEASFKQALTVFRKQIKDTTHLLFALIKSNLGLLYHTTGRYTLSESYTTSALELRKSINMNGQGYAASLNNLAVLYKDMGKYNEAEELIEDAIDITEKTASKKCSPYAIALNNQAMILQAMGRYPNAEPILNQAIEIAGETLNDKSTNYVRLMTNLALLYQDMKKYSEAETIYNNAIKIKENRLGTNHPDYAHLLNNLAALYMLMNKYDKVEDLLKKSTAIYKRKFGENHPSYASSICNLGSFYRVMNRTAEAEPLLKQTVEIRSKTLGENHPEYVNSLEGLGLLYWQTGKYKEASEFLKLGLNKNVEQINSYFAPMSEAEKAKFWDKIRPKFLKFNSFVCEAYKSDPSLAGDLYNYQLISKALLLNSSNKIKQEILNSGDQVLITEYKQWLDEKENLGRLYSLSKAELEQEHINVDSLELVCNQREKKLSAKSSLFSQGLNTNNKSYKDIQQVLTSSESAVEIIQFNKFNKVFTDTVFYLALVLTKETEVPKLVLLENGKQLEKRFYNIYKNSIKQRLKDENSYQQFWSKIDQELGTIKNIYVSLDGIYNQINLNTLSSPQGTLIDLKNIRIVTNTKDIIELKNRTKLTAGNSAVLVGFPDYGPSGSIPKLPGTKTEIEGIKSILTLNKCNSKTYLAADANEANLKEIDNPKILHIATHGFFLPENDETTEEKVFGIESSKSKENPLLRSGLMMSGAEFAMEGKSENGILFAYEAMNMSLDKTEIVVMSACETGLGDVKNGEGVYGLQRAFQVAGAKAIIMSLWKVNDQATQQLMTSFYKNYSITGDKNSAFKKAQQELKNKFKDPYYWGAFVMIE